LSIQLKIISVWKLLALFPHKVWLYLTGILTGIFGAAEIRMPPGMSWRQCGRKAISYK
jgi:hypothetical protein